MATSFDIASENNAAVLNTNGILASISGDGDEVSFLAFDSVTGVFQAYLKNELTSALTLVSQSSGGVSGNASTTDQVISTDGVSIALATKSTNLVSGASTGSSEVYIKTPSSGALALVSQTAGGVVANGDSQDPALSSNGSIVAFDSRASNLGLGGTGTFKQVYLKTMPTGTLTLVSQTANGTLANAGAESDSISSDGTIVVFDSDATDLGSSSGVGQVYSKNAKTGALTIVSETGSGAVANGTSANGSSSADGSLVAFSSSATNLLPGVTSGNPEIYVKNLSTGALTLVSAAANGTIANGNNDGPIMSADGKYIIFNSTATNLVPNATSGSVQVYIKNLQTGALSLLSQNQTGVAGNDSSDAGFTFQSAFSADDAKVVFTTSASNLAGAPPAAASAAVLRATTTGPALAFNPVTGDDVLDAGELGAPVTFSGTSDAIGGTVQVSLDTAANSIGTATVAADGTWSLSAAVGTLAGGAHTEIATAQGSSYLSTTATKAFTVDTGAPTVAFTPGVTFKSPQVATLSGTVSDPSGTVASVEVSDDGTALGSATLNGDGTWTLSKVTLPLGTQTLTAVATDTGGNASPATSSTYSLETGIHNQPYADYEEDFDAAGNFTGEVFTKKSGQVYLADTAETLAGGDVEIDYSSGSFFGTQDFSSRIDLFGPSFDLRVETLDNNDGTTSVTGFENGQTLHSVHDDVMTGGGRHETFVFKPQFGQDEITDFQVRGAGHDIVSLPSSEFAGIAQILSHTHDAGGSAVIHVGAHQTITLDGITTAELKANRQDFKLHA